MQENFWKKRGKQVLVILAVVSLAGAFLFGQFAGGKTEVEDYIPDILPEGTTMGTILAEKPADGIYVYEVLEDGDRYGFVTIGHGTGYIGPMSTMVLWSAEGVILNIQVIEQTETASYYEKLFKEEDGKTYFERYIGKAYDSSFVLGEGIDAASGATRSSEGVNSGVLEGLYLLSTLEGFTLIEAPAKPIQSETIVYSIILVSLLAVVFIIRMVPALAKLSFLRYITLVLGFIFIGLWISSPLSLANFAAFAVGFAPDISASLYIYVLVFAVLGLALIFGKNFYCYWICPFNALQEGMHFIGGSKVRPVTKRHLMLRNIRFVLLWAVLMIVFIMRNPAFAVFEPWGTLFHLFDLDFASVIPEMILVGVTLILAVFIYDFWCHYLCPVGAVMDITLKIRQWFVGLFKKTV